MVSRRFGRALPLILWTLLYTFVFFSPWFPLFGFITVLTFCLLFRGRFTVSTGGVGNRVANGGFFTITDIPERFNGKFIFVEGEIPYNHPNFSYYNELVGYQDPNVSVSGSAFATQISNGIAIIPLWLFNDDNERFVGYTGNDTFDFYVEIQDLQEVQYFKGNKLIVDFFLEAVKLSNGNATVSFLNAVNFTEF